jgi:hypothetical protein
MMESCYDSAVKCGNKIQFAINELLQKKVSKQKLGCSADGGYFFLLCLVRIVARFMKVALMRLCFYTV